MSSIIILQIEQLTTQMQGEEKAEEKDAQLTALPR